MLQVNTFKNKMIQEISLIESKNKVKEINIECEERRKEEEVINIECQEGRNEVSIYAELCMNPWYDKI